MKTSHFWIDYPIIFLWILIKEKLNKNGRLKWTFKDVLLNAVSLILKLNSVHKLKLGSSILIKLNIVHHEKTPRRASKLPTKLCKPGLT
jgi:hypothetical protein